MTSQEIQARLQKRPELFQHWVSAMPIEGDCGALYLSSIFRGEESVGTVHLYIWDKKAMGKPLASRRAAIELMRAENLDRLVGEIDCQNYLAVSHAKKMGFNVIGIVRQRKDAHGKFHDVVLMDALPGDLVWE